MKDHITPSVWGPSLWRGIHFIALGYPENPTEESIQSYGDFFVEALPKVIPCKTCADNYIRHLRELPITPYLYSGGKHRLFEWTVEMHNIVNKELGKTDPIWTTERALTALTEESISIVNVSNESNVSGHPSPTSIAVGLVIVLALIAIIALLIRLRKA